VQGLDSYVFCLAPDVYGNERQTAELDKAKLIYVRFSIPCLYTLYHIYLTITLSFY